MAVAALFSVASFFSLVGGASAQADADRAEMRAAKKKRTEIFTKKRNMRDKRVRDEVVRELRAADAELRGAVKKRARKKGIPMEGMRPDGRRFQLVDFDENDQPVYLQEENVEAAITTAANEVRDNSTYNGVDGSSVTIGLWEAGGIPRLTHREFGGRITVQDVTTTTSGHATHVAGTLIAEGIDSRVKGMAPGATISAFGVTGEQAEMLANGASAPDTTQLYLSNHSYGVGQGWEGSGNSYTFAGTFSDNGDPSDDFDEDFGRYAGSSASWDFITSSLPYYLVFVSSGNHRNDGPDRGDGWSKDGVSYTYDPAVHPAGDGDYKDGWDNMEGRKLAKNVITVGSAQDAVDANGQRDVTEAVTNGFSSRGPADDGRIKPDITANGDEVRSTESGSNSATGRRSGTSMSTPNATGSAALLIDYYSNRFPGQAMRASTLKGLILHTADDDGNPGPDYRYGWGIMNTKVAADVIKTVADGGAGAAMLESGVTDAIDSRQHVFGWDGTTPLRVTLCWTDPAGSTKSGHDNRERALVNDLNLTVTGPDGVHYPYVMPHVGDWSIGTIDDDAVTGVNTVDNVEQVFLETPVAGAYTITVNYAGDLDDDAQDYSLIVTGQSAPEIVVEEGSAPAVALVDNSGVSDFGPASASQAPVVKSFTIRNGGGTDLTGLAILKSGTNQDDFTVGSLSASELVAGGSASFSVSFDPEETGARSALLRIVSNDADENPFEIHLSATGLTELDGWRLANFNTTVDTGDAANGSDADRDGLPNLMEFGLGSDPEVFDAQPIEFEVDGAQAKLTYPRSVIAMEDFDFGAIWSETLAADSWFGTGVTEVIISDDGVIQQVEASIPLGTVKRFFRLEMSEKGP